MYRGPSTRRTYQYYFTWNNYYFTWNNHYFTWNNYYFTRASKRASHRRATACASTL